MKIVEDKIYLSASDLSTHIACPHATFLNLQEAKGSLKAPGSIHAALQALQKKGEEFENNYLDQLKAKEKTIIEIDKTSAAKALQDTLSAMAAGADIIYQARLQHDIWNGWADFLIKVNKPGKFGWSYEVMDTKLSRETKAGAILQICLYSEILKELQGRMPERMYINNPNGEHQFRVDDFMAFYRLTQMIIFAPSVIASSRSVMLGHNLCTFQLAKRLVECTKKDFSTIILNNMLTQAEKS